jgi:hypothetical protein
MMTINDSNFKNSNASSNKIINNSLDSSNTQNNNTFNNFTSIEVSDTTIISHDSCNISSNEDHNSNTQNPSQTDNNFLRKLQFLLIILKIPIIFTKMTNLLLL